VPTSLALFAAATASKIAGVTGGVNEASTATVRQLSTNSWFSIAKAERLLGWKPEVPLNTGMQASQEWAQSQGLIN